MHHKNYKDLEKINPRQYMFTIQENLRKKPLGQNLSKGFL